MVSYYYVGSSGEGYSQYTESSTLEGSNTTPNGRVWGLDASADGTEVYVMDDTDDILYRYDETGTEQWSTSIGGFSVALDEANSRVYTPVSGTMYEFDTADGSQTNTFSIIGGTAYGVDIYEGDLYVASGGDVAAYTTSGSTIWTRSGSTGDGVDSSNLYEISVDGGIVATAGFSGIVYALDTADGSDLWNVSPSQAQIRGLGTNSNGTVVIGNHEPAIREYDSAGNLNWTYTPRNNGYGVDISNDGNTVIAGDAGGWVYDIDGAGNLNSEFQPYTTAIEDVNYEEAGVTLEQISASQTSVGATMNTTTVVENVAVTATQVSASATMESPALTEKFDATQPTASATMVSPAVTEKIDSTQVTASATANATTVDLSLDSTQVSATGTMLNTEVEGITTATATTVSASASMNGGQVTVSDVSATQFTAQADMLSTELDGTSSVNASQVTARASMNSVGTRGVNLQSINESNTVSLTATQNSSSLTDTTNKSELTATANEVN